MSALDIRTTQFAPAPGTPLKIAGADRRRRVLYISPEGGFQGKIAPDSNVSANRGLLINNLDDPIVFRWYSDLELCLSEWWIIQTGGPFNAVTVIEVLEVP